MALLQTQLATLIATNTFGQNTPAIIATEAEIAALKAQIAASQTQATQLENQLERARAIGGINTAHTTNTTGFVGGGQGGCNYQLSHLVIGVEADVSGTAMAGSSGSVFGGHTSANTDFITDVTGRLGYAAGPWLIYAKGGAAWSDSSFSFTASTGAPWTWSGIRSGWTAGTGIEWAFLQSWSAKLEYQYYDFASSGTLTSPASTIALGNYVQYIHTIKLGFNWHLYTGASPRH
jgi:outer membrane immunogenic protein